MAVTLTGSGGLFTRLGKIFKWVEQIETHQDDIETRIDNIVAAYSADPDFVNGLAAQTLAHQLAAGDPIMALRTVAHRTLIEMVDADTPLPQKTADAALRELIRQMEANDDDIDASATAANATSDAGNSGNGNLDTLVWDLGLTTIRPLQYVRPETIVFKCIRDAQLRGTEGNEVFEIRGTRAFPDIRHPDWPGGSGHASTVRVSNPSDAPGTTTGRQALTNGDFEDFTVTNTPDNWTIVAGTVGTHIFEEGTIVYRGDKSLQITGDGSNLTRITQQFGTTGQTTGKLIPSTAYAIILKFYVEDAVAAGVLRISLRDAGNTVIGGPSITNEISLTLSSQSKDEWNHTGTALVTPAVIPSGAKLVIELTTAITDTASIYIDDVIVAPMHQTGAPGAPLFLLTPGDDPFHVGDRIELAVTNNYAGAIGKHMDRFFDLYHSGLVIPHISDGSETIADTLIA